MGTPSLDRWTKKTEGWLFTQFTWIFWAEWTKTAVWCGHRGWNLKHILWHSQQTLQQCVGGSWRRQTNCFTTRFSEPKATIYRFFQQQWTCGTWHSSWEDNGHCQVLHWSGSPESWRFHLWATPNDQNLENVASPRQCGPPQSQAHHDLPKWERNLRFGASTLQSWLGSMRLLAFPYLEK